MSPGSPDNLQLNPTPLNAVERALSAAQERAQALFDEIVSAGLIRAGVLESELSSEIHELATRRFGVRRHWHRRVVRCGPNTVLGYHEDPPDRQLAADDVVYLDLGPVFEAWEADFGRTYVIGTDPRKHQLVADIGAAFRAGKQYYRDRADLTAGELYDFVCALAPVNGWIFAAPTAGHLIGHFPHERAPAEPARFSIRHGNPLKLRELDAHGAQRHWILEIHFADPARTYGGFYEQLLSV